MPPTGYVSFNNPMWPHSMYLIAQAGAKILGINQHVQLQPNSLILQQEGSFFHFDTQPSPPWTSNYLDFISALIDSARKFVNLPNTEPVQFPVVVTQCADLISPLAMSVLQKGITQFSLSLFNEIHDQNSLEEELRKVILVCQYSSNIRLEDLFNVLLLKTDRSQLLNVSTALAKSNVPHSLVEPIRLRIIKAVFSTIPGDGYYGLSNTNLDISIIVQSLESVAATELLDYNIMGWISCPPVDANVIDILLQTDHLTLPSLKKLKEHYIQITKQSLLNNRASTFS
jgi:hypothetical protein